MQTIGAGKTLYLVCRLIANITSETGYFNEWLYVADASAYALKRDRMNRVYRRIEIGTNPEIN
jgi:hypothetical protein